MATVVRVTNNSRATIVFPNGFAAEIRHHKLPSGATIDVAIADHMLATLSRNPNIKVEVIGDAPEPTWEPPCLVRYPSGPQIPEGLKRIIK